MALIAAACLEAIRKTGAAPDDAVSELCSLAVSADSSLAKAGTEAIFGGIVEPLCDEFRLESCDAYIRFFSRVISECRQKPSFEPFDRCLSRLGLTAERQVADRALRLRNFQPFPARPFVPTGVQRVLLPSRVTLGADIAVTSVVIDHVKQAFPLARVDLLGSRKVAALFSSDPRVQGIETDYRRGGTLQERLDAWVCLTGVVADETRGLAPGEFLIIDPDSRLTQLGLLPLTSDPGSYYFFESRGYTAEGVSALGALASRWLDQIFPIPSRKDTGTQDLSYPYVSLSQQDLERGLSVRASTTGPTAAVNLGVGGNSQKRVSDAFEFELLNTLLASGYQVILDRGAGEEELERAKRLTDRLRTSGRKITEMREESQREARADVLVWEGSLNGFGGLIAAAQLYAGYDSAGGHLAAALNVPVIDIFTSSAPPRMRGRWTPWGKAPVHVITADSDAPQKALAEFEAAVRERRK